MLPWRGDAPAAVAAGTESSADANAAFGAREKKAKATAALLQKAKAVTEGASRSITSFFNKQTNERTAAAAASSVSSVAAAAAAPAVASPSSSSSSAVPSSATAPAAAPAASAVAGARVPVSAYGVWVSEIMLQQTRVETVIDFYTRWMRRFPRVEDLASASLEEVHGLWAGLGYYRRAKFLHLGAQEVVSKHGGALPGTLEGLKEIKGIGPYTAAAIGSIALGLRVPLVDGNVVRVYSRLRAMNVDPKSKSTDTAMWALAAQALGEEQRPGDFNQALMELGATVCTPLNPQCATCPVSQLCHARNEVLQKKRPCDTQQTADASTAAAVDPSTSAAAAAADSAMEVVDIEALELPSTETTPAAAAASSSAAKPKAKSRSKPAAADPFANPLSPCTLCISAAADGSDPPPAAVTCYPAKASKKPPLEQHVAVCIVKRPGDADDVTKDGEGRELYLIIRRPSEGLLANQWELPSVIVEAGASAEERAAAISSLLSTQLCLAPSILATVLTHSNPTTAAPLGEVTHLFSHRKHIMRVTTAAITLRQQGDDPELNDCIAAAARDRVVTIEDTEQKSNSSSKKRSASSSGAKKNNGKRTKREEAAAAAAAAAEDDDDSAKDDEEEEENDEDDAAAASSSSVAATSLRSYRWVPLSLLQQDHKHSSGSELGLSSAQRKVVQLVTNSNNGSGATASQRKPTTASKKKSGADKPTSDSKKKKGTRAPKRATAAAASSAPRCVIELESDSAED